MTERPSRALGRIEEDSARALLIKRLQRITADEPDVLGLNELALALWKRRHPELLPAVRQGRERLPVAERHPLDALLVLLEKSPEELGTWALDPSVPVEHKTGLLALLEEDLPDAMRPAISAFIAAARPLFDKPVGRRSAASYYCERLFSMLLAHREHTLGALREEERSTLRGVARALVAATSPIPSLWAAVLLEAIGCPEDAAVLEVYCPEDPTFAKVFRDAARALRDRQRN